MYRAAAENPNRDADRVMTAAEQKVVDRMLRKAALPEEITEYLVGNGWHPERAADLADHVDRQYQDNLRENVTMEQAARASGHKTSPWRLIFACLAIVWGLLKLAGAFL